MLRSRNRPLVLFVVIVVGLALALVLSVRRVTPPSVVHNGDHVEVTMPASVASHRNFTAKVSGAAVDQASLIVYSDPQPCASTAYVEGGHRNVIVSISLGLSYLNQDFGGVRMPGKFNTPFSFMAGRPTSRKAYVCAYITTDKGETTTAASFASYTVR